MGQIIPVIKNLYPKQKPQDENKLGFGRCFTDHMFVMDYVLGQGWINPRIEPYAPLLMDPSTMVLHYGQASFEGMKAYRRPDGGVNLFRPLENFKRINITHERMGIPTLDPDFCLEALTKLMEVEQDWVPSAPDTSLYIRPFAIATDPYLGVRASHTYKFMIILSPSGPYYSSGLNPVSIRVEDEYVRAVRGGTGFVKCPGNYASSILSQEKAHDKGFSQVLWLDGVEKAYIEEVGSMNFMFVRNNEIYTPKLNGSILAGITRKSVLELLSANEYVVREETVALADLVQWIKNGEVSESFGTGTAAVISPIGTFATSSETFVLNNGEIGPVSRFLYDRLTGMQYGRLPDDMGWVYKAV